MKLQLHGYRFASMGCPCVVKLYAQSGVQARQGFDLALAEIHRLDLKYSHYRDNSYLVQLSALAAQPGGVAVDEETAALLNYAETQFEISEGLFDITTRGLSALWDRITSLPSESEIASTLRQTGWERVWWNGRQLKAPAGIKFDLGGIVKEYAADRAAGLLKKAGFGSGYVDLGGDLHFLGPHPDGRRWKVGIRNPDHKDRPMAEVETGRGGLATSGDYERYSEIRGVRYSHIIDPRTGWPVSPDASRLSAVSALAPSCLLAGSVSTLGMLLTREKAITLLQQSGLACLAVGADRKILLWSH